MRTDYTGAVAAKFTSLPWGDDYAATIVKATATQDFLHFAGLEQDTNSSNNVIDDHAQFRSYSFGQGRWLSPDPYDGSYDATNPQSFNRYAYVLNNPLSFTDPLGLNHCVGVASCGGGSDCANDPVCQTGYGGGSGGGGCSGMFCDPWGGPPGSPLDAIAGEEEAQWLGSGSIPWYMVQGGELMLLAADPWFYVPTPDPNSFTFLQIPTWVDLGTTSASSGTYSYFGGAPGSGGGGGGRGATTASYPTRLFGTHWCGPGGAGPEVNQLDTACHQHDTCYDNAGLTPAPNFGAGLNWGKAVALQSCNQALCNAASSISDPGSTRVQLYFSAVPYGFCHP